MDKLEQDMAGLNIESKKKPDSFVKAQPQQQSLMTGNQELKMNDPFGQKDPFKGSGLQQDPISNNMMQDPFKGNSLP